MKKILLLAVFSLMVGICSANDFAYDAQIDGIYYNFLGDEAIVTYQQYQQEYQNEELVEKYISDYTGAVVIPESVTYNDKTYRVTAIGDHAFFECSGVTSITIPSSVDSIGGYAFRHCSGLTSLAIPESVGFIGNCAIADCANLTSVNIPSKVTTLSIGLFIRDASLTSINIPETVDSIFSVSISCIICSSTARRPAVSTITTL